jgi:glycosyltransferase involved in cell wall biosynthesis
MTNKNKFYYLIKNMNSEKNKKIKLTHIICSLGYGGAERFLIDLIKNTDREKYEISVLCVIEGGPLVKELELNGIHPFIIEKKTKLGISTIWKIYKYLEKEKIQIVHTHLFAGDTWGRIAAVLAQTPIIISTEHSVNFNEGIIKRLIKKNLSYFTDKIIAISETVKENSQKRDWINPKKIEVIYNGINLEKFSLPLLTSLKAGEEKEILHVETKKKKETINITLGFVARLEKEKGAEYLIKALHLCHSRGGGNLKLKILGDGTQRKSLETMSNQLGLKKNIEFLGFKNNPTEFYQEIDILIIPSLWEGLSIVALEAMSAEIPIIASNAGGLKEIIEDRKTGLLFEPENSKNLAEKILWAIENSDKMNMMAQNAKIKVKDFDIKKKAKEYERIYENFTN